MKNIKKLTVILLVITTIFTSLFLLASCNNKPTTKYTLSYETFGGSTIESVETNYIKSLPIPSKKGFHFINWYYNPQFTGNPAIINSDVLKDITLYAKFEEGIFKYDKNSDDTVTITDLYYCPQDKKLIFPTSIKEGNKTYPVKDININVFSKEMLYVEKVSFESDITITNLPLIFSNATTVDLSKLTSLKNISVICQNLTTLVLPNVETIPTSFLTGAYNLKNIVIPSTVTKIENNAFTNCNSIESVNIPSSVTSIGRNAFNTCNNLKNINILSDKVIELDKYGISTNNAKIMVKEELIDGYKDIYHKDFNLIPKFQFEKLV